LDCIKKIISEEGALTFYKGNYLNFYKKGTLSPLLGVGGAVSI
jgi:hypothetical protein